MNRRPHILNVNGVRYFQKHTTTQRVQSIIQFFSVIILAMTGLPTRYADTEWANIMYQILGGPNVVPNIHRTAGLVLLSLFIYHTIYWLHLFLTRQIKLLKKNNELSPINIIKAFLSQTMIFNKKDIGDIIDHMKYVLYLSNKPAAYERIMWKDKFEYFAQYWGITVISVAGVMLWWRDEVSLIVPGIVLNIAYIFHTNEALLAVMFLFFVHWYHEYYCPEKLPIPTGFWSGYVSEKQMIHEHYARYARLMRAAGLQDKIKQQH